MKPTVRPSQPNFSSGPTAKRPGWSLASLEGAPVGRSHRSAVGKAKLREVIERTRSVLGIPEDFRIGIVPASDTGAVEMALWGVVGARPIDMLAWESFGSEWVTDVATQLKPPGVRTFVAPYGCLPDLGEVDFAHDVVFAWNGTTSGVCVPDGDWIPADRQGLTICDATSAAFAMELPWDKLDVTTWSWQKVLGGEGAHGMLVLSPRAVERLESYRPPWPLPKIFRLVEDGKLKEGIFQGETINTPSLLCVEDALDGLKWAESVGGLPALLRRCESNAKALTRWVHRTAWVDFLAADPMTRSPTSGCLRFVDPGIAALGVQVQSRLAGRMAALLEAEGVAYDVKSYKDAPPGLRIWCGATVQTADIQALTPWLDWAYAVAAAEITGSPRLVQPGVAVS